MKILQIITTLGVGGAEKLLIDSIPFYKERGIEMDLALLNGEETSFLQEAKKRGINVVSLGNRSVYNPVLIFKIITLLKNYDIVHVHLFPTLYWVALAKIISNHPCRLVYTEHNTHNKRRDKLCFQLLEKWIYKQYEKIITISDDTKINLIKWLGRQFDNRVEVIANGINVAFYAQALPFERCFLGLPSDAKIILMTARFTPNKDQNTLIKAFNKLADKNTYLLFIGDGPLRESSKGLVTQLNLENRVSFLGVRLDVAELMKMSDICVLSSNWEGFGLVAVEYMASGRPVIASDVDGLRDIVGGAGVLFEKGNEEELKSKIEQLFLDQDYYRDVVSKCAKRALSFGIAKMVDSYIDGYERVLNEK